LLGFESSGLRVPASGVGYKHLKKNVKGVAMLWTISVILLSLWLLGISTPSTLHGYIHVLLGLAVLTTLLPFLRRRKQPVD
jgi:hypothetical protein